MSVLLAEPVLTFIAVVFLIVLGALIYVGARRPYQREIERLREDLHGLLSSGERMARIPVNGRLSEFVDITASVNRLLDRGEEAAVQALIAPDAAPMDERNQLFDTLAETLPDVAMIHTNTILFANRCAGELFGVDAETLAGKPITDLLRPAYRALMRKHVIASTDESEPLAPLEVQLISNDDQGLWAELFSRRLVYKGEPALLTVARDITHRKRPRSAEASYKRGSRSSRSARASSLPIATARSIT
jgi:PAS domain S-box-containing protein